MASTFSPSLKLELVGDGDQSGIWGQTTNTNLGTLLEQAITGVVTITMLDATYTLTSFNGVADEARNAVIVVTGTNSQQRNIVAPLVEKTYTIKNSTTGGFAVQIIGSSGTGVVIPNGVTASVYCDGTNFYPLQVNTVGNQTVNGNLAVTGTTSLTGALTATTGGFSGVLTAPTAAPGTNTTQVATTAFVQNVTGTLGTMSQQNANNVSITGGSISGTAITATTQPANTNNTTVATTAFVRSIIPAGVILMWSGSVATIPTGWLLCDGTSGTPDLRSRFIVGAGSTYAVGATGGSADATLVAHTHTYSGTTSGQSANHTHSGTTGGMNANNPHGHSSQGNGAPNGGGAGVAYVASTGNQPGYQTTLTDINHGHDFTTGGVSSDHTHSFSGTTASAGSSATNANLPPYYALAYIMKS